MPQSKTTSEKAATAALVQDAAIEQNAELTRQLEESQTNGQAILRLVEELANANSARQAAEVALSVVREAFGWDYGSYWRRDPHTDELRFVCDAGQTSPEFQEVTQAASFREGVGLSGRAWRNRDLVFVEDIGQVTDCVRAPVATRMGVKSGLCFPLIVDGQVEGTLDFFVTDTIELSDERTEALRRAGQMVSREFERVGRMAEATRVQTMMESAPTNVMYADQELVLRYMNPASVKTLQSLQEHLPRPVDELLGQSIDIFHKEPSYQRRLLADPSNLPHRANIELGPETLDLLVSPIRGEGGAVSGYMVTWDVVTKKLSLEREAARIQSMMENAPTNVMYADLDLTLRYLNPASERTLRGMEQYLPLPVDQFVGTNIDAFHKDPSYQRRILADPANLPRRANIQLGPETLDLLVSPITDNTGEMTGYMVTWEVVTERLRLEQDINEFLDNARGLGESSERLTRVSQEMATNAEQTSNQANLVSAAAEEVSTNLTTVATGSEQLGASIREIAQNASEAAKVATEAVEMTSATNTIVTKLGDSSSEIGEVIKVITSIAQQTNLLALNATIEAARAGEAGKGFAVVANEVKELAKETARATDDISKKIETIQTDSKGAVGAISQISEIINRINDIQATIASAVEEQTVTTNEISRNVNEAARGSSEIASNITTVATAAQTTLTGAGESQECAQELSGLAGSLRELMDRREEG